MFLSLCILSHIISNTVSNVLNWFLFFGAYMKMQGECLTTIWILSILKFFKPWGGGLPIILHGLFLCKTPILSHLPPLPLGKALEVELLCQMALKYLGYLSVQEIKFQKGFA